MHSENKLFKNTFVYFVTNVASRGVTFLLLPIMTRYLTPHDYGILAVVQVVVGIVSVCIGMNVNGLIVVNYFKITDDENRVCVWNSIAAIVINTLVVYLSLSIIYPYLVALIQVPYKWVFPIIVIGFSKAIVSLLLAILRARSMAIQYAAFQFVDIGIAVVASLFLIVILGYGWEGRFIGIMTSSLVLMLISLYVFYRRHYVLAKLSKKYLKNIYAFGLPLVLYSVCGCIITGVDRFFIIAIIGADAAGLYSVGYQVGMAVSIVGVSFNIAWAPYFYYNMGEVKNRDRIVRYIYLYCVGVMLVAFIISTIVVPFLLPIVVGKMFYGASKFISWIAFAFAFEAICGIFVNFIFYAKKTYILSVIIVVSALLNCILTYMMIKLNGALGAAQATFLTYIVFCLLVYYAASRLYKMPWLACCKNRG